MIADLAPAGALQEALAQRIAVLLWRLDRVARLEAELFVHGHLARQRDSMSQAETQALVSRCFADHLGEKVKEARGKLDGLRRQIDVRILTEAPSARVLVERQESARAYDQLARHEAMLQRALDRTLDEFRRLRNAARAAAETNAQPPVAAPDPDPAPAATADPDPAPSRGVRPPAPGGPRGPAGGAHAGAGHDGENAFLQNEANSAQPSEEEANSGVGADSPTAPPVP